MKNNKKLVIGLLALSICTLIGSANIAFANEVKPLNEVKNSATLQQSSSFYKWTRGFVTADELNVRSGPGTHYTAFDSISEGYQIDISTTHYTNGFYFISYWDNGQLSYGWVFSDYIQFK